MNTAERMLGGSGMLLGPSPRTQLQKVIELVSQSLPVFAASAMEEEIDSENGLNSLLSLFISKKARKNNLPFIALHQSMENLKCSNSPVPDIGIFLDTGDEAIPPRKITVFEGKRLTSTKLPKNRHQEYVIRQEKKKNGRIAHYGGIERFKLAIHGGTLKHAGMIGYLQDETAEIWHERVNSWIRELCKQPSEPAWSEQEQLTPTTNNGRVTEYTSAVERSDSKLHLTHLWISLV